jgi:hypothetical protein
MIEIRFQRSFLAGTMALWQQRQRIPRESAQNLRRSFPRVDGPKLISRSIKPFINFLQAKSASFSTQLVCNTRRFRGEVTAPATAMLTEQVHFLVLIRPIVFCQVATDPFARLSLFMALISMSSNVLTGVER